MHHIFHIINEAMIPISATKLCITFRRLELSAPRNLHQIDIVPGKKDKE